jgi:lactate dehydrogenase-like 2-hydroxyacid dehydrogenase
MKPEILLIESMMPETEAQLDAAYRVHRLYNAQDRAALLKEVGGAVRAVATGGRLGASGDIIDALPRLEIIAINGVGTDAVDLDRARARSIRVTTTPDVLTEDVADLALGLMIAVSRRICAGDRFVRAGRWANDHMPLAASVHGKRLGIFGLGHIGRAVARRAEGFSMPIAYTERHPVQDCAYRFEPELAALAEDSDFLVLAASATAATHNIVTRTVLDALGPSGILINVSRGSVVDEDALVAALAEKRLGGAGLDVFAHEPQAPRALWSMDNVVLMPHQASATVETRHAMADLVLANLAAHFAGRELPTPVI